MAEQVGEVRGGAGICLVSRPLSRLGTSRALYGKYGGLFAHISSSRLALGLSGMDDRWRENRRDVGGHPSTETREDGGGPVSFTFQRMSRVRGSEREGAVSGAGGGEEKDYVVSLEGREIQSVKPGVERKEYVVPLIRKNVWRLPQRSGSGGREGEEGKSEEEIALEREAAEAIMRDLHQAQLRSSVSQDHGFVVPLVMQNKPPTVEGREGDELADVDLRPEQSSMEDYESMPIDVFGEAVLRGMGWKKGAAIGKSNKGLVEPIEFIPRLGGLGLGATPKLPEKKPGRIRKPGEEEQKIRGPYVDKEGRVRHVKRVGEEIPEQPPQGFGVGRYARVLRGPHESLYGKIVGVDEDSARVVLRLAINGQNVGLSQHHLELVGEEEYSRNPSGGRGEKRYGLIRKQDISDADNSRSSMSPRDQAPSSHTPEQDGHKHRDENSRDAERPSKRAKHHQESQESSSKSRTRGKTHNKSKATSKSDAQVGISHSSQEKPWLASHLRVRIVDTKFKKGLFYNTKVVIFDVVSLDTCICQTEDGKLLEGVKQHMLETVVPKTEHANVMVVGGKRKGQIAAVLDRDRSKYKVVVELIQTGEIVTLDYDDVCEYTGDTEDM